MTRLQLVPPALVAADVHLVVLAYLLATTRKARQLSGAFNPSDRLLGLARRNEARTRRFILGGMATIVVATVVVAWPSAGDVGLAPWRLAVAAFAAGFNIVALLIESVGVVARRRLLVDVGVHLENQPLNKHDDEH